MGGRGSGRRGRPPRVKTETQARLEMEFGEKIASLGKLLESESTLRGLESRRILCEQAAALHFQIRMVAVEALSGFGKAEVVKSLPPLISNFSRLIDRLGITKQLVDDTANEISL